MSFYFGAQLSAVIFEEYPEFPPTNGRRFVMLWRGRGVGISARSTSNIGEAGERNANK
jgi:ribosome biogenesis protein Nip4